MNFTEHVLYVLCRESLQDVFESLPELLDHATVPVGAEPLTVALHAVAEPTTTEAWLHETVITQTVLTASPVIVPLLFMTQCQHLPESVNASVFSACASTRGREFGARAIASAATKTGVMAFVTGCTIRVDFRS